MDTRSSPSNDSQPQQQQQQQQQHTLHLQQQQMLQQQHASYTYPAQQQPQGSWTPSIAATPFYPAFYQNQQQSPQPYPPQMQQQSFFDPTNAQLAAQWAYQQMMFNAQHGFPTISPQQQQQHHSPSQRSPNTPGTPDYFPQSPLSPVFNPFPSGTPPPHTVRGGDQQNQNPQYPGFHPYRRPNRQQQQQPLSQSDHADWRSAVPHPPYGRPDASGSTSSVNSSSSQRQRTNSNQSAHSSAHNVPSSNSSPRGSSRNTPLPAASSSGSSANQSSLRTPHNRSSSSSSTSTATSVRPSGLTAAPAAVTPSTSTSTSTSAPTATPRMTRPSPLSQGNFTASEKRMSKDDIDLGTMHEATPTATMIRSGGIKGRLRRALSFSPSQALKEEQTVDEDDEGESIKASRSSRIKGKAGTKATSDEAIVSSVDDSTSSTANTQTIKKRGRAASLFNSRLNASTDNISLSSTVSSASVMIRKLGAMGKLARRNSLAGITSLFKDKDKDGDNKDRKAKKKDKKGPFSSKGVASEASVSHVTAELDRMGGGSDWSADSDMNGLSPAAKLARHHTLKSNAEAAAKAKATQEAAAAAAAAATEASSKVNGVNGSAGVPTWDRNTATRQGSLSPVKGGGGVRINEDGTRTFIEDDEDSDNGHYGGQSGNQSFPNPDGWDDDEDWDLDGDGDEDVTIRVGMDQKVIISEDDKFEYGKFQQQQLLNVEPWAIDVRRSVERTRKPAKGILKRMFCTLLLYKALNFIFLRVDADTYDQQVYLADHNPNQRTRSNSYNSPASQPELGPLARIPSPDPDHIDGLRHGSHTSLHGTPTDTSAPVLPPLSFESPPSPLSKMSKDLPATPFPSSSTTYHALASLPPSDRSSAIFQHPNFNSSAPALSTIGQPPPSSKPPLTHRSATTPIKRLVFASNLSVYDTFSASVYDRRSEPATWSRLTPALAQRIKEELNSYKMEEMEVHAASRIQ